jgi:uncharacterized protein with FMN-binding domain
MTFKSSLIKTGAICSIGATIAALPLANSGAFAATTKAKSGTFLGAAAQTRFGAVQVAITVTNGKIKKVTVPVYPTSQFRDQQINSQAIPLLVQEVIQVQSKNIQGVTGASYTSQGFYTSLVSVLSKAGIAS